jgi:type III pantothenate kinase
MNLVIDLGNTWAKAGLFSEKVLVKSFVFDKNASNEIKRIITETPDIKRSIVSSVISHSKEIHNILQNKTLCIDFDSNIRLPLKIVYQTPETLGKDRIAAVAGAIALYPGKPLLVIDGGTCMKYNFVSEKAEFYGGAISPGLDMRFKSLNVFTDRLPQLSYEKDFSDVVGNSTAGSILSGVQKGILFEAEGYIKHFHAHNKQGIVLATGGSLPFLVDGLKNSIFAAPDLILYGLNEILLHHTSH